MSPEKLPTAGQWFTDNIGLLIFLIFFFTTIIYIVWTFLDKEKKAGFWRKFLISLVAGFFITVIYFVYKMVIIGLERLNG